MKLAQLSKRRFLIPLTLSIFIGAMIFVAAPAVGELADVVVHSPSLEDNLLGDSADRNVTIYLPPGYDDSPDKRYPVVYLLHGFGGNNTLWTGGGYLGPTVDIQEIADDLIDQGHIKPLIMVMPDAFNSYSGSWYLNSTVTGNWEDFIVRDLVEYVDSNYRTIPASVSRGISGHSMGGYGALSLAAKYPNTFGAVYGMSAGTPVHSWDPEGAVVSMVDPESGATQSLTLGQVWESTLQVEDWESIAAIQAENLFMGIYTRINIALGASVTPNPEASPFFADLPFELVGGELSPVESVQEQWLGKNLESLVDDYASYLARLQAIYFDCGSADLFATLPLANLALSQALSAAGISHVYEEFEGSHSTHTVERLRTKALPMFSQVLESVTGPMTAARRATVVATVTEGGIPASGVEVAFSRSICGSPALYLWKGTTDADGQVEIEIVAHAPQFLRRGASGYYLAKVTDPVSGEVLGRWTSIPIRGGKETVLSLPVGERASVEARSVLELALGSASPNPFNPSTQIGYQISETGQVTLVVYNTLGQQVRVLVQGPQGAGHYQVTWDGRDNLGREVSSGVYLYRLKSQGLVETNRMLLLK